MLDLVLGTCVNSSQVLSDLINFSVWGLMGLQGLDGSFRSASGVGDQCHKKNYGATYRRTAAEKKEIGRGG